MGNYNLSLGEDKNVLDCIKEIILKRHPIVEDRMSILYPDFDDPATPEMEVIFDFLKIDNEDITVVLFLDGTYSSKATIDERIRFNGLLPKKVICDLINYLLTDHDYFKDIYRNDKKIGLSMNVDGREDNMHGISCGEIKLELNFMHYPNNINLLNEYLNNIVGTFYDKLKNTSAYKSEFLNYCNSMKKEFVNSLSSEELRNFIALLSDKELSGLICSIPNDCFQDIYNQYMNNNDNSQLIKMKLPVDGENL